MKTRFLFPHRFKKAGWYLVAAGTILLLILQFWDGLPFLKNVPVLAIYTSDAFDSAMPQGFFKVIRDDINFELCILFLILGSLLVAFSRTKHEDEFIARMREESLVWATYVQYIFLALSVLCLYGTVFINVLVYNLFTMLWLFIARFHYKIFRVDQALAASYEK